MKNKENEGQDIEEKLLHHMEKEHGDHKWLALQAIVLKASKVVVIVLYSVRIVSYDHIQLDLSFLSCI